MRTGTADLVCFSQLRWDFVVQRPHHLMGRAARDRRVWFVEEPVFEPGAPRLVVEPRLPGLQMVRPIVPPGRPEEETDATVAGLLGEFAASMGIERPLTWYYTPMAMPWSTWLEPSGVVYDCMDELSAFRFAPARLGRFEAELLARAQVVFTGGHSLYVAKRGLHPDVHAMPSAVDVAHFSSARNGLAPAAEEQHLPGPRIGWFGVIDERMDLDLLAGICDLRPAWSFVMIGPIVKIDPATLPIRANLHLLGSRHYDELPAHIAAWDAAIMPFARNESTRFISPTKTLEYLAAGRPVVSTSIRDVVEPFERLGLVRIADEPAAFVDALEAALADDRAALAAAADDYLAPRSWDATWDRMRALVDRALARPAGAGRPHEAATEPASAARRKPTLGGAAVSPAWSRRR